MNGMQFERVDAAAFVLFHRPTASRVGVANHRRELFVMLEEVREDTPQRLEKLVVVAVDDKGQRIDSWPALSILTDA